LWRQSRKYPGEGNDRFFNYAVSLRSAGISLNDIELKLRDEATFGNSPKENGITAKRLQRSRPPSRRLHGDRTQIVALAEVDTVMTQNRISGRDMEMEVRQQEMVEVVVETPARRAEPFLALSAATCT